MAHTNSSPGAGEGADEPLAAAQVSRLKPVGAIAPVPASSILPARQPLLFSSPCGKRPKVAINVSRIARAPNRDIWRVDVDVSGAQAGARVPLRMRRIAPQKLRSDPACAAALHGHRPPWASMSFKARSAQRGSPILMVKDGKVLPLSVGDDRRQAITNSDYPWWCVGLARSNCGAGTGVLIGRNIVLTAAHVVPWDSADAWMTFSPGWNIPTLSFGEWPLIRARGYRVTNRSDVSEYAAHDVALVQLETPLGDTLGYFGAKAYQDRWDGQGCWMSVGYPDDWPGHPEYQTTDTIDESDDEGLAPNTEASLARRNSGAPIFGWFKCDDQWAPYVVGIASSVSAQQDVARSRADVVAGANALVNLVAWGRANLI